MSERDGIVQGRCPFGFGETVASRRSLLLGAGLASGGRAAAARCRGAGIGRAADARPCDLGR